MIDVRSIQADEGELLRAVRLAALLNAPAAFLETYDEVASDPSDVWAARAAASTGEGDQLIMVALDQGRPVGMAGIAREIGQRRRHCATLWGVWLDPAHRGRWRSILDSDQLPGGRHPQGPGLVGFQKNQLSSAAGPAVQGIFLFQALQYGNKKPGSRLGIPGQDGFVHWLRFLSVVPPEVICSKR